MLNSKLVGSLLALTFLSTPALADVVKNSELVVLTTRDTNIVGETTTCSAQIFDGILAPGTPSGLNQGFQIPSGQALIITDIDWAVTPTRSDNPPWMTLSLGFITAGGGSVIAYSTVLSLDEGAGSRHISLNSGIVVPSLGGLCAQINSARHDNADHESSVIRLLGRVQAND